MPSPCDGYSFCRTWNNGGYVAILMLSCFGDTNMAEVMSPIFFLLRPHTARVYAVISMLGNVVCICCLAGDIHQCIDGINIACEVVSLTFRFGP